MSILRLENKGEPDILPVPGVFIDYYLPAASGQDIKIFLYLLRQASRSASLSTGKMAVDLDVAEVDVLHSLENWEEAGLLRLKWDSMGQMEAVEICDIEEAAARERGGVSPEKETAGPEPKAARPAGQRPQARPEPVPSCTGAEETGVGISDADYEEIRGDSGFLGTVYMMQMTVGRNLTAEEERKIASIYDYFGRKTAPLERMMDAAAKAAAGAGRSTTFTDFENAALAAVAASPAGAGSGSGPAGTTGSASVPAGADSAPAGENSSRAAIPADSPAGGRTARAMDVERASGEAGGISAAEKPSAGTMAGADSSAQGLPAGGETGESPVADRDEAGRPAPENPVQAVAAGSAVRPSAPARTPKALTAKDEAELSKDPEFTGVTVMAENMQGRPLSSRDMEILSYWYVNFGRSTAIMEELIDYCMEACSPRKPLVGYLDKVAVTWFENWIDTAEKARDYSHQYNRTVDMVLRALGYGPRNPREITEAEQKMVEGWQKDLGMPPELIQMACERAANATGNRFAYAGRILEQWHQKGIATPEDVKKEDEAHAAENRRNSKVRISKSAERAHNFEERDTDYDAAILRRIQRKYGDK